MLLTNFHSDFVIFAGPIWQEGYIDQDSYSNGHNILTLQR